MFRDSDLRAINTLYLSYNETVNALINSNAVVRSLNHCRRGKAISITYSECVPAALIMHLQSACAPLYFHLRRVRPYHIFPHYLIQHDFRGGVGRHFINEYFDLVYTTILLREILS